MSSTVAVCGMLTVLEIAPERNGWTAPIILMWPGVRDRPLADRDVEHRQVLGLQPRRADDRAVLGDVGLDLLDLRRLVAERAQRHRHRAVGDHHRAAADQLLVLDEREVGLDAGRVAVHQERDRPRGREHRRLRVAVAVELAERDRLVPGLARGGEQRAVLARRVRDRVRRVAVHPHDVVVRLAVLARSGRTGRSPRRPSPTAGSARPVISAVIAAAAPRPSSES